MSVAHFEVHLSAHPEHAQIVPAPTLADALRVAAERHGTVVEVLDFDE